MTKSLFNFFNKNKYLIPIFLYWTITRIFFFKNKNFLSLYIGQTAGHVVVFYILIRQYYEQYYQRKEKFEFKLEMLMLLGIVVAMVDMITRLYFPFILYEINNSIIFLTVLFFIYGRLKIPFKKNIIFLMLYASFYFILTFEGLNLTFDEKNIISIILTVILSIVFAYSLLAISKTKNFYHCTYCCAVALICVLVIGKRLSHSHMNLFIIVQQICSCLVLFSIFFWYDKNELYQGRIRIEGIFNVQLLPNAMACFLFALYSFKIKINEILFVWGLFWIILIWYVISVIIRILNYDYKDRGQEKLTLSQINRIENYIKFLDASKILKKKLANSKEYPE